MMPGSKAECFEVAGAAAGSAAAPPGVGASAPAAGPRAPPCVGISSLLPARYQWPTSVQPKAPLEECPHASAEGIAAAFSPGAGAGIRSLPNAMQPGFRQLLYSELVRAGRASVEELRTAHAGASSSGGGGKSGGPCGASTASCAHPDQQQQQQQQQQPQQPWPQGMHGSSLARQPSPRQPPSAGNGGDPTSSGQPGSGTSPPPGPAAAVGLGGWEATVQLPGRFSSARGFFSLFRRLACEYGSRTVAEAKARAEHHSLQSQVCASDFVVRSCPLGLRGEPAFGALSFESRPFVETDHLGRPCGKDANQQQQPQGPAFLPAGRGGSPAAALKSQAGELVAALSRQISRDFPKSFLQVFQDSRGAVVVSFARSAAAVEGDVAAYMGRLASAGPVALQFRLCKDTSRWGVVEDEGDTAFFAFWPPWAPRRHAAPVHQPAGPATDPAASSKAEGSSGGGGRGAGGGEGAPLKREPTAARGLGLGVGIRGLL